MSTIKFPYGKEFLHADIPDSRLRGILTSKLHGYKASLSEDELIKEALASPIESLPLYKLAEGKNKVVIIASDHTRPVPSKIIIPPMLDEIRRGNPDADITILIATGCHRGTTKAELTEKFGEDIVSREKIVVHDCADRENLICIGTLPSGGELSINRIAYEADLLVSEGFIEPHFFAVFSGGRKSVLPGIASREAVLANHCSKFIAHPCARTGILENNPIHKDMLWAAKCAHLSFIVIVVIDENKRPIFAVAGDVEAAHKNGCEFLSQLCKVNALPSDIVITTNGGYPLDQNIYQAVKGMTAAEATIKDGGVIIMLAKSNDGHGGDQFYRQLAGESDIDKTMQQFLSRGRCETIPDQWQTQIFLRVLKKATVIYISDAPDNMIREMHMLPAHSIEEALEMTENILNNKDASITVIPDGVSVIVEE